LVFVQLRIVPIHKLDRRMCSEGALGAFHKWRHVERPIHKLDRCMCSKGALRGLS